MPITTTQPAILPPTTETVCDRIWVEQLVIDGKSLSDAGLEAHIVCRPYHEDANGVRTFAPPNQTRVYHLSDLYGLAAITPEVAQALQAVLVAVQAIVSHQETPPESQEGG